MFRQHIGKNCTRQELRFLSLRPASHVSEAVRIETLTRVVCDYIAGMTDHYVEDLRKKLMAGKKPES